MSIGTGVDRVTLPLSELTVRLQVGLYLLVMCSGVLLCCFALTFCDLFALKLDSDTHLVQSSARATNLPCISTVPQFRRLNKLLLIVLQVQPPKLPNTVTRTLYTSTAYFPGSWKNPLQTEDNKRLLNCHVGQSSTSRVQQYFYPFQT